MTTAPSLFSIAPNNRPEESNADRPARSLVDLLYDGFYMLILLSQRSVPRDPDEFSGNIQKFLDQFERSAKMRIPTKLDSDSTGSWTRIPEQAGQSARSDAGCWGFTRVMSLGSSCRAWA